MAKKSIFLNLTILLFSLIFSLIIVEIGYRIILFNSNSAFNRLKKPGHFADYFSEDDFWKLYYLFGGHYKPPHRPHPLLGWIGDFDRKSYIHNQTEHIGDRRPVLLYGDSFASCAKDVLCFQEILNTDQVFSKEHYLLNYGVGGYGVDQIFLLFQKSFHQYNDPLIVISLMTLDLDRSILSVRLGQKPYFILKNNELKLRGVPINPNFDVFFATNPPQIKSYLYQRIIHSNLLPNHIASFLKRDNYYISKKKQINEKIILEIVKELRANDIDYVFLIFHTHWPGVCSLDADDTDWRNSFLKKLLHENNIPYIWSKDIFKQDTKDAKFSYDDYIIPGIGHPTTHFNRLIADEIKKFALKNH